MKKRILVVEDEEEILNLLQFKLLGRDYEVLMARSAEEFVKVALSEPVHLVILDIWLRGWIGTQVYSEILALGFDPEVPVIFITALLGEEAVVQQSVSKGKYALYRKPFNFDELMGEVDRMLNRGRSPDGERRNSNGKSDLLDDRCDGNSLVLPFSEPDCVR